MQRRGAADELGEQNFKHDKEDTLSGGGVRPNPKCIVWLIPLEERLINCLILKKF
jgi:hypothetical protein